jgi:hypothetical protein
LLQIAPQQHVLQTLTQQLTIMQQILRLSVLILVLVVGTIANDFGTSENVPAGAGINKYFYPLEFDQTIELDVISPSKDFSFELQHLTESPYPDALSPRDTPVMYFKLIVPQVGDLTFNAVIDYTFNTSALNVPPETMEYVIYRSGRWRYFDSYTQVTVSTQHAAQGFDSSNLKADGTYIAIYGGNTVDLPYDDSDRYQSFNTEYTASGALNQYAFEIGRGVTIEMDILGPKPSFSFKLTRPTSNPFVNASFPTNIDTVLSYLNLEISGNVKPTYNIVFRYKYDKLLDGVRESTLVFVYYKSNQWSLFTEKTTRGGFVVTQAATSIQDFTTSLSSIAIVGSTHVPTPPPSPPSPQPSPTPQTSIVPAPSQSPVDRLPDTLDSSNSSNLIRMSMILSIALVLISVFYL